MQSLVIHRKIVICLIFSGTFSIILDVSFKLFFKVRSNMIRFFSFKAILHLNSKLFICLQQFYHLHKSTAFYTEIESILTKCSVFQFCFGCNWNIDFLPENRKEKIHYKMYCLDKIIVKNVSIL